MSIFPLPVFEADAESHHRDALTDEEIYARLEPPKSMVVKFGYMKLIGEYPYDGKAKPGCGSKLVARTHRGTEIVEMLTTTCPNTGCGKAISRQEMLEYIDNSGGKDYPFHTDGQIVRVATIEDMNAQAALDGRKPEYVKACKALIAESGLEMKLVEAEPILGGELLTFYYMSEGRVDFREIVRRLAGQFKTRIEMRQIGARDEARLVADYERCGQHCCCKNFLKVLKPVSMRSAKVQKATLDPLKISGRCGRLMCCLRYEDETYEDLRKRLPRRKSRVGTAFGPGIVMETKILVQLALVRLEHNNEEVAVPIEELMDPETCPQPDQFGNVTPLEAESDEDPLRGMTESDVKDRTDEKKRRRRSRRRSKTEQQDQHREASKRVDGGDATGDGASGSSAGGDEASAKKDERTDAGDRSGDDAGSTGDRPRRKRGRRRRGSGGDKEGQQGGDQGQRKRGRRRKKGSSGAQSGDGDAGPARGDASAGDGGGQGGGSSKRKRSRGRRRRRGGGDGGGGGSGPTSDG